MILMIFNPFYDYILIITETNQLQELRYNY